MKKKNLRKTATAMLAVFALATFLAPAALAAEVAGNADATEPTTAVTAAQPEETPDDFSVGEEAATSSPVPDTTETTADDATVDEEAATGLPAPDTTDATDTAGAYDETMQAASTDSMPPQDSPLALQDSSATSLTVSGAASVAKNATLQLTASALPAGTALPEIVWSVTNRSGSATVTPDGLVTGRAVGTVIVRAASSADATVYGEKAITVTADPSAHPAVKMANLVVFVRFADDTDTDTFNEPGYKPKRTVFTDIKERYNCTITSVADSTYACEVDDSFAQYIRDVTGGEVEVANYFPQDTDDNGTAKLAWLDLTKTKAQVGDSDEAVIAEVISAFNNGTIPLPAGAKLDNRESGVIDNLTIVVQGSYEDEGIMRSHKSVSSATGKIGGSLVRTYNVLCGNMLIGDKTSLIAHEFLHSMGLPDLYRYSGYGDPVGIWDIMASEGGFLQYPLSYQRAVNGWMTLPETSTGGEFTLTSPLDGGGEGLILRSPLSESEFFVVEYRKKNTRTDLRGYELKIPKDGVIVYRVNTAVENLTNAQGNDYIYLFRDGETGLTDSYSADKLRTGAVLGAGESRGTSNLSDAFTENTLFYSDGTNSGIVVTADGVQPDGTMKISVSYPDYSAAGLWDKLGGAALDSGARDGNALVMDDSGSIYAAYIKENAVTVKKYSGDAWTNLGTVGVTDGIDVTLAAFGGNVYVSYADNAYKTVIKKWSGGTTWTQVYSAAGNFAPAQLATDGTALYAAAISDDSGTLRLLQMNAAKTGFTVLGTLSAKYFTAPALAVYNGVPVVASNDYFTSGAPTLVQAWENGGWAEWGNFARAQAFRMDVSGGMLWLLCKPQEGTSAILRSYDGSAWSADTTFTASGSYTEFALSGAGGAPTVLAAPGNVCRVFHLEEDGTFAQKGHDVRSAASGCDMLVADGTAYAIVTAGDGSVAVYTGRVYEKSSNARLASLSVSGAALSPAFDAATTAYRVSVGVDVNEVEISATAQSAGAVVTGTGVQPLVGGDNTFNIQVTAQDGVTEKTYTVIVTRKEIPATRMAVKPTALNLLVGETAALAAMPTPVNTTDKISFTSDQEAVVTVDADTGAVTAVAPGTAKIRVATSGGKYADCTVRVYSVAPTGKLSAALAPAVPAMGLQWNDATRIQLYVTGSTEPLDASLFTFTGNKPTLATVDETGLITAKAGAVGTVRITAKLTGDPAGRSLYKDVKIIEQQASAIRLTATAITPLGSAVIDNNTAEVQLDQTEVKGITGGYRFRISAEARGFDGSPLATAVTWTSANTAVATVTTERGTGDAIVTVKGAKAGECAIVATSKDLAKTTAALTLQVRDYAPRLVNTSVVLNPQLAAGVDFSLTESYGNSITDVQVLVPVRAGRVTTYEPSDTLALSHEPSTDVWTLNNLDSFDAPTQIKNQSIAARLRVTTARSDADGQPMTYDLPLRISVRNTQPSVTVRQAARFNLFYKSSTADVKVSAKGQQVTDIALTGADTFAGTFAVADDAGVLTVAYKTPSDPTLSYVSGKMITRGTLAITLAGYNWPVQKTFTLSTATTRPSLALTPATGVINTALGRPQAAFTVYDRGTKAPLALDDGAAALAKTSPAGFATLSQQDDALTLALQDLGTPEKPLYRGGTATVSIQQADWLSPISLTYRATVQTALPTARVDGTLRVSSVFTDTACYASLPVTLNQANLTPKDDLQVLTAVRPNAEAAKLDVRYENGTVSATVLDSTVKNGTYAYSLTAHIDDGAGNDLALRTITVNVNVSSALPTLRVRSAITVNRASFNAGGGVQPSGTTQLVVTNSRDALVVAAAGTNPQADLVSGTPQTLPTLETNAARAADAAKLAVQYENGEFTAIINDGTVRTGSYRYKYVPAYLDGSEARSRGTLTVTVSVVNRA